MIALKKPNATKCSDHHTISPSLIAHRTKKAVMTLRRRIQRKIEDVLGDQIAFRRRKGTRDVTGTPSIIT